MGSEAAVLKQRANRIHLVNPSNFSFGIAVIAPRWLYVIAAATPPAWGDPHIVDETIEVFDPATVEPGDIVGIGIHTGNALRGYEIGRLVRVRGAWVVFGGIHASLFPLEAIEHGAHSVVKGDGEIVWQDVVGDCAAGRPTQIYDGGRVPADRFTLPRWDLLPQDQYMWASVQTLRGCPKHCSFCSVWRVDGQEVRNRTVEAVIREVVELRRRGFRFIVLADDNFYPVTFADLAAARRRSDPSRLHKLSALREERFELMRQLALLPDDLVFFTQITMEAAEDPAFLDAMRSAKIRGALIGVESITTEGLKDVYKGFNVAGDALVTRLRAFKRAGVHVLGSFIFGLPSDRVETFEATLALARQADLTFAQFVLLTPYAGTVDYEKWVKEQHNRILTIDDIPVTRHWLIPQNRRPKLCMRHPTLSEAEICARTQQVWDRFYSLRAVWGRSRVVKSIRSRLVFVLVSKLYREMYVTTAIATDRTRLARSNQWARRLGALCRRAFMGSPMPDLVIPAAAVVPKEEWL
jgi:radical SAM superfamily enzyme YgiQ (UPF0313 family)